MAGGVTFLKVFIKKHCFFVNTTLTSLSHLFNKIQEENQRGEKNH